jgi:serine/threonine-protein phosphatase 2A regulatory subunit B'
MAGRAAPRAAPDTMENLPSFKEVPNSERPNLFVRKLRLCSIICDFTEGAGNDRDKEIKRQTLLELVDYVNSAKQPFVEAIMPEVVNMVSANIFRPLPSRSRETPFDPEEDEPILEAAWPHLHIVYEFFLRFVVSGSTEAKVARKYMDTALITRFLELFDSEDPRERDYLKTILHRIYGKFMPHRAYIRKAISNVFYRFIYETERHNGIAELLEILGSIINGFALPLKDEHKQFLSRALIPLHKPAGACIQQYHQQLSYCITQYLEKDPKLADIIIKGLIKYWPHTNSGKEVLFLNELEELLELTQSSEFAKVAEPLFRLIARCINSPHFQVSERALFLWNNEYIVSLIAKSRDTILPVLFPALEANTSKHWNSTVHGLTFNVQKLFMDMDARLWEDCSQRHKVNQDRAAQALVVRKTKWEQLEMQASKVGA